MVLQFLQLLQNRGFLYYSFTTYQWEWKDAKVIEAETTISDNILDIVVARLMSLPENIRQALMVISCLGTTFPIHFLLTVSHSEYEKATKIYEGNKHLMPSFDFRDIASLLDRAVEVGILSPTSYLWSHDKVQQAAYSLIEEEKLASVHFLLGKIFCALIRDCHEAEEYVVYAAASQLNQGRSLVSVRDWDVELAKLNLKASNMAISKSAFYPAVDLLRAGAACLDPETRWEENYDLCLEIFNGLAEMECIIGNYEASADAANEVLEHSRSLRDQYSAHEAILTAVVSGPDRAYNKGVVKCLEILAQHGESFPSQPSKVQLMIEKRRLLYSLPGRTLKSLLDLPPMTDEQALNLSNVILSNLTFNTLASPDHHRLCLFAAFRSVRLSCKYGICTQTGWGLMVIGLRLKQQGKVREACEVADLANEVSDGLSHASEVTKRAFSAKLKAYTYGGILFEFRSINKFMEVGLECYKASFQAGDMAGAFEGAMQYCICYFCLGLPLASLEQDAKMFSQEAHRFGIPCTLEVVFRIFHQTALNFQGKSADPLVMVGDALDEDKFVSKLEGLARMMTNRDIFIFRLMLACHLDDMDLASTLFDALSILSPGQMLLRKHIMFTYLGLAAFALSRHEGKQKYRKEGKKILASFHKAAKLGSVNAHPVFIMLQAVESPSKKRFDEAIRICGRSGLVHYQAYINERAGVYFLEKDDESWAQFYLSQSMKLYRDWGATSKVDAMSKKYPFLSGSSSHTYVTGVSKTALMVHDGELPSRFTMFTYNEKQM